MGYKMKGHTLPGINQRSDAKKKMHCGRADSAAFQSSESPIKQYANLELKSMLSPIVKTDSSPLNKKWPTIWSKNKRKTTRDKIKFRWDKIFKGKKRRTPRLI